MVVIEIIDEGCEKHLLKADNTILGRKWDNDAESIQVIKPESEAESVCTMIVTSDGKVIDHILVEDEPILVSSNLSQYDNVRIGFSFSRLGGYIKNSEIKQFYFLNAQKPDNFVPVEPEQKDNIDLLIGKGFINQALEGTDLVSYGINGQEVARVDLSGFIDGDVAFTADKLIEITEDSDSIVVGTNEDGTKAKFSLDADLTNKIMKSLIVPMSAPTKTELVGVDDGNSQTMIEIGSGLKLENGVLYSTTTGGGEGGGSSVNVVDSLTSQSGTDALSARQGNVLYNMLVDSGEAINQANLNAQKQVLLGADGVINGNTYSFTVENPDAYIDYRTNLTKFLVDLNLPIVGELDTTKEVGITFGDTSYYVFNILKGMQHATIADLHQVDKYSNETGYRFIAEMTFFENSDITGFAIIPTISMSDILSLDSDQMDNYLAEGGLTQGQLAICKKVITNGYEEGGLYRFDIVYPDNYTWTQLTTKVDLTDYVKNTDYATSSKAGVVKAVGGGNGVSITSDGILQSEYATEPDIKSRTSYRKPITPINLDYAVKIGLTVNKTELTQEEKTNAQKWLGVAQFTATQLEDGSYSLTINTEV